MSPRNRESTADFEADDSIFGSAGPGPEHDEFGNHLLDDHFGYSHEGETRHHSPTPRGAGRRTAATRRRHRRVVGLAGALIVVIVALAVYLVAVPLYHYLDPRDYSGAGSGAVIVVVHPNDGAQAIADTLLKDGVVASTRAFTDAANNDSRSRSIQPGSYRLHRHMSGKAALQLLLDPTARLNADLVVTEGATVVNVAQRLAASRCTATSSPKAVCGLGVSKAAIARAMSDVSKLGLPTDYKVGGKAPMSVEGFLYPATYSFDEKATVTDALQQMVAKFTDQARSSGFTARAKALHITPYQELIIASIAQGEAKFAEDMPRVARVILNRLAAGRPLQIDATSAYGAKLKGLDPTKVIYAETKGPYNTYVHAGLPPTPIGNPGVDAMQGAAHPASGPWLYYVNGDAEGHLFFTASETAFARAVQTCKANHWGCG